MSIYTSFLLRCWLNRGDAPATYAIEHVQSGEKFRASSLAELMHWIEANHQRLAAESPSPSAEEEGNA